MASTYPDLVKNSEEKTIDFKVMEGEYIAYSLFVVNQSIPNNVMLSPYPMQHEV